MSVGTPLPPKPEVAKALLRKGSLFVHLDPRMQEVLVPTWLRQQAQLVLQVGMDMPIPIPDLRVDDEGVFGTLSFSRNPFTCCVPWHAVFALVGDDGRGMVWPESMPSEIAAEIEREALRAKLADTRSADAAQRSPGSELGVRRTQFPTRSDEAASAFGAPPPVPLRAAIPEARRGSNGTAARPASFRPPRRRRSLPPYLRVVK